MKGTLKCQFLLGTVQLAAFNTFGVEYDVNGVNSS